mgnify:CR=1 FL=1
MLGYGKIAYVDLTDKQVEVVDVGEELAFKYIGGRGWAAYIIFENLDQIIHGTHPSNVLVVATGPLDGTIFKGGSKTTFAAISPLTGIYGDSIVGGHLGSMMRRAGIDALVIRGASQEPCYLLVEDGRVEVESAEGLWGLHSRDADRKLREIHGDCSIATIGIAGEKLVSFACINVDWDLKLRRHAQAGRTGMGAVMGSKKLKAIVAKGGGEVEVADPERLAEVVERLKDQIVGSTLYEKWERYGTMSVIEWSNEAEALPTKNFQYTRFDGVERFGGEAVHKIEEYTSGCANCMMPCGHTISVGDGHVTVDYENFAMLGPNLGLGDLEAIAKANYLCDYYGLDTISTGSVIAFVMECFQRGILDEEHVGFEVRWGDAETVYRLIKLIAERKGFGNLMALGVRELSRYIGGGSERFAMHVKGLEISAYDHRAAPAMALSYATCDIGAHHNRSWAITYDLEIGRDDYGEDKARRVIYLQHLRPLFDMLGVCRFPWVELKVDPNLYAEAYSAVVGKEFSLDDLLLCSERVWNLTRVIAILKKGIDVEDDTLPARDFEDPIPDGETKGSRIDRERFMELLRSYYRLRGWDERGWPTREKLLELGLEEAVEKLYG